jgi:hypothetical protein
MEATQEVTREATQPGPIAIAVDALDVADRLAPPDAFPRPPHPSSRWREYFRANADRLMPLPWADGVDFTPEERAAIASSVQEFQLGESSEGRHLVGRARAYAERSGDGEYLAALRLFIAEEHRHARDLGRVLALAGIPLVGSTWPDTVFRRLRRGAGLELSICVLVTAEIIAKVYYAALREATGSSVLRRLCDQILRDEVQHVRFQAERVALLRHRRPRLGVWFSRQAHRALMAGTCLVVWHKHGRALRKGGRTFARFWRDTWRETADALRRMDPATYAMPAAAGTIAFPSPRVLAE